MKCVHILLPLGNLKALLNSPGVLEPLRMAVPEPLPASKYSRLEIYRALPRPKNVNIVGASSTPVFRCGRYSVSARLDRATGPPLLRRQASRVSLAGGATGGCALTTVALRESSRSVLMRPEGGGGLGGQGSNEAPFYLEPPGTASYKMHDNAQLLPLDLFTHPQRDTPSP